MPRDYAEVDNLRTKSSIFGNGFCLQGLSPAIKRIISTSIVVNSIGVQSATLGSTEYRKSIDAEAAKRVKHDTYVDGGLTGGSREEVERFCGSRLRE